MVGAAISVGILLFVFFVWSRFVGGWKTAHQQIIGSLVIAYGLFLATLTGTATHFVVPGVGSVAVGAGTGAVVGFLTWLVVGTVGVATGGVGIAMGAGAMAIVGALFGGTGAAVGGAGFVTEKFMLVNPVFWGLLVLLGMYLLIGTWRKKKSLK
jgi:hypothetical protein